MPAVVVLLAQHTEQRSGLLERPAAGLGDHLECPPGGGRIRADHVRADAGLHRDQRHAVRDHVVQLPSDPQSLLGDGRPHLVLLHLALGPDRHLTHRPGGDEERDGQQEIPVRRSGTPATASPAKQAIPAASPMAASRREACVVRE